MEWVKNHDIGSSWSQKKNLRQKTTKIIISKFPQKVAQFNKNLFIVQNDSFPLLYQSSPLPWDQSFVLLISLALRLYLHR